jgi:hypothetical protein
MNRKEAGFRLPTYPRWWCNLGMLIQAMISTGLILAISAVFFALGLAAERVWPAGRQPSWPEMRLNLSAGVLFTFIGEISGPLDER